MAKKLGRPIKLEPDMQVEIVKVIQSGNYLETAACFAGISVSTLRDWIKRGEREAQRLSELGTRPIKSEAPFLEFSAAIKKAQAEAEIRDVMLIGNAARESWQAAAWRLERRYPEKWGRRERHEISGIDGKPIQIDEVRDRLIRKFEELNIKREGTD